jgi:hypothetical protein
MLKETLHTVGANRRWYTDDYFELIVWYHDDNSISGFQLCYDRSKQEHALTWRAGEGSGHHRIDSGEASPLKNMTPVLLPDGVVPYTALIQRFQERAANIDPAIVRLVVRVLNEGRALETAP